MKKRYLLGLAISALLLFLLFRSVELASVARALQRADMVFLLPAIAFYFGGVALRTLRWALLLDPVRRVGVKRLFVVLVVGFMANDILPLRAGEGVRALMLWQRERLEPGATLATIVVERIFDGLALTGFLVAASLVVPLEGWLTQLAWIAGIVFLAGIGAVLALTVVPGPLLRVAEIVLGPLPARLRDLGLRLLSTFVDGLATMRSVRAVAAVAFLSVAAWLFEAAMYWVLMFSFPFPPRFVASTLGTAVANLASMIPSSPGYVGTFDFALLSVLSGSFRVDPSLGAAYTGLVHAALIVPVTLLGLFFVWRGGLSLRQITAEGARNLDRSPGAERVQTVPERTTF